MRSISLFRSILVLIAIAAALLALLGGWPVPATADDGILQHERRAELRELSPAAISQLGLYGLLTIACGALAVAVWTERLHRRSLAIDEAIRQSERRLRHAEILARCGHYEWDMVAGQVFYSEGAWRLLGLPSRDERVSPELFLSCVHPKDQARVRAGMQALLDGGQAPELEFRVPLAGGGERVLVGRGEVQHDAQGRPLRMSGYFQDLTESRAAQRTLTRFKTVLDQTQDCIFMFDPQTLRFSYANRGAREQVGVSEADLLQRTPLDLIPGFDEEQLRAWLQPLIEGRGGVQRFETVHRHRDGHDVPVEIALQLISLDEGRSRFLAVVRDVTDRKQAEEHWRLAAQVFEQSREGIIITNAEHNIIAVNEAFSVITGYGVDEARGQNPRFLASGLHGAEFYRSIWDGLRSAGHWQGEITDRRKDGTLVVCWLSITRLQNAAGEVTNYIATFRDLSRQKAAQARIRRLADFDLLTGLPNRVLLTERASQAIRQAQVSGRQLALMFLDLDHFKNVNDTLGHRSGDDLLVRLSQRLVSSLRGTDTVSRLGGDEFILLLPGTDAAGAATVAQSLLTSIAQPCRVRSYELTITASIGIAVYPADGGNLTTLMRCADTAMYRAKSEGRHTYRFFTAEMQQHSTRQLKLEAALRRALERKQMFLHYQPQISLDGGRIVGVEALLRWRHPRFGMIPPSEFIPLAEESGLILPIGEWVLRTAVRQRKAWLDQGLAAGTVAVNLSAVQFRQVDLPALVAGILEEEGLPPELLELELTETVATRDPAAAVAMMDELSRLGVRLAIDDFGTGHASLSYLKRFRIDKLKIERTFVHDLGRDPEDEAIVEAILGLARSLKFCACAEGVETAEQLEYLRARGCDQVQGFYFSRPVPPDEVAQLVAGQVLQVA